jgi:alpha-tubulin suppressor-like RCC1 family protein
LLELTTVILHKLMEQCGGWGDRNSSFGTNFGGSFGVTLTPIQMGTPTSWTKIVGSAIHSLGIRNGVLYAWGEPYQGNLGIVHWSPTLISNLSNWSSIAAGNVHSLAIKTDGTLWSFGENSSGQVGRTISSNSYKMSPGQIGALTTWSKVATHSSSTSSFAIKTDQTLWGWGNNYDGVLGVGTSTNATSPLQIGSSSWSQVATGATTTLAVRADGTLWSWGKNAEGQLGLGDTVYRSSPNQVGSETNWSKLAVNTHALALKTNGTLWSWGTNTYGELGGGVYRSSPVQIGQSTEWITIAVGYVSSGALKPTS